MEAHATVPKPSSIALASATLDDAVLERVRGVGGVVLHVQLADPEPLGQPVGLDQRRGARGERAGRLARVGQEVLVAPDRARTGLDLPPGGLDVELAVVVRDLQRAEAALADVASLQRVLLVTFLALKRLGGHASGPPKVETSVAAFAVTEAVQAPLPHLPDLSWSPMELAPFPPACGRTGWLPGFHRAMSLHPSGCERLCLTRRVQGRADTPAGDPGGLRVRKSESSTRR